LPQRIKRSLFHHHDMCGLMFSCSIVAESVQVTRHVPNLISRPSSNFGDADTWSLTPAALD
jgi:hypothetical protein